MEKSTQINISIGPTHQLLFMVPYVVSLLQPADGSVELKLFLTLTVYEKKAYGLSSFIQKQTCWVTYTKCVVGFMHMMFSICSIGSKKQKKISVLNISLLSLIHCRMYHSINNVGCMIPTSMFNQTMKQCVQHRRPVLAG